MQQFSKSGEKTVVEIGDAQIDGFCAARRLNTQKGRAVYFGERCKVSNLALAGAAGGDICEKRLN